MITAAAEFVALRMSKVLANYHCAINVEAPEDGLASTVARGVVSPGLRPSQHVVTSRGPLNAKKDR